MNHLPNSRDKLGSQHLGPYRPHLEILEDRLPPGDSVLGAFLGSALLRSDRVSPEPDTDLSPGTRNIRLLESPNPVDASLTSLAVDYWWPALGSSDSSSKAGESQVALASQPFRENPGEVTSPSVWSETDDPFVDPFQTTLGYPAHVSWRGSDAINRFYSLLHAVGGSGGPVSGGPDLQSAKSSPGLSPLPGRETGEPDWSFLTALTRPPQLLPQPQTAGVSRTSSLVAANPSAAGDVLSHQPLDFEANRGQADPQVQFLAHGPGYTLFLTPAEMVFGIPNPSAASVPETNSPAEKGSELAQGVATTPEMSIVRARLVAANPQATIMGQGELLEKSNYFRGNDPTKWVTDVPHYSRVVYRGVYPGVDLIFYGNSQKQLEYDWVVAPGADPGVIRLAYQGTQGLRLDVAGNLIESTPAGDIVQHAPTIYQEVHGVRQTVAGHFVLQGSQEVSVAISGYDSTQPLIIDPVLNYSTYLGGNMSDQATAIAVDASGCMYVTGRTNSTNFPLVNPIQSHYGGGIQDAFVTKLTPDGSQPIYSTYLGGFLGDVAYGIAVDANGDAYVTGNTLSGDFPTVNALFPNPSGPSDAFVSELDPTGSSLVFSTYLGGNRTDTGTGIGLDASADIYVAGRTSSTNFPMGTNPGFQPSNHSSDTNAFLAELAPSGTQLVYSTYFGGSVYDEANAIAVEPTGIVYLTGDTGSSSFPTTPEVFQRTYGGAQDAFVAEIDPSQPPANQLVFSSFLGGSGTDQANGIAVDGNGNVTVTGFTNGSFPLDANPLQPTYGGGSNDAFVTKLTVDGSALVYSTYLGGSGDDEGNAIAVDSTGNAYVTGFTNSPDLPTTGDALQPSPMRTGATNAFVVQIDPLGDTESYASYFGGSGFDQGWGIAADNYGDVYLAGLTTSTDFPTELAFQQQPNGPQNAFAAVQQIPLFTIVNVIPNGLSGEANQDDEPSIAVNPTGDPSTRTVAVTTFSRFNGGNLDAMMGSWGQDQGSPVWVSTNNGGTWSIQKRMPQPAMGVNGPVDQTLAYDSDGSQLYGAFLSNDSSPMKPSTVFVRSTPNPSMNDFAGGSAPVGSPDRLPDQPWIQAIHFVGEDGTVNEHRVYVAFNDASQTNGKTAAVIVSKDGGTSFQAPVYVDFGNPMARDEVPRVAVSGKRVYVLFARDTALPGDTTVQADIVVARDDKGGIKNNMTNPDPFHALSPPNTTVDSGMVPRLNLFFLGQERLGSDYSIAIDPSDTTGNTVYVAYVLVNNNQPEIHVAKSTNGGAAGSWAQVLQTPIANAALPALAVAANGTLGVLYTRLVSNQTMSTEFLQLPKQGKAGPAAVLTAWPKDMPMKATGRNTYIGDYQQLVAVGNTFYGALSASNKPDASDFPKGVYCQRNFNNGGMTRGNDDPLKFGKTGDVVDAGGNVVSTSIDPFFFRVSAGK